MIYEAADINRAGHLATLEVSCHDSAGNTIPVQTPHRRVWNVHTCRQQVRTGCSCTRLYIEVQLCDRVGHRQLDGVTATAFVMSVAVPFSSALGKPFVRSAVRQL